MRRAIQSWIFYKLIVAKRFSRRRAKCVIDVAANVSGRRTSLIETDEFPLSQSGH